MASEITEFSAVSGQTLTVKAFAVGSDTQVESQSATEATNRKGIYTATFTTLTGGTRYHFIAMNASNVPFATWYSWATGNAGTIYAVSDADLVRISRDATAADNLEAAADGTGYNLGGGSVVAASVTGAINTAAGTITTLDALDTAQDTQHSTTQAAIAAVAAAQGATVLQTTTIATLASQTQFTLTAGSADDDVYNDATIIFVDQSTATQKAVGYITDYTGSTKTVRLLAAPGFTVATGDTVHVVHGLEAVHVRVDAALTSTAGTTCHIVAWLEWRGQKVAISGATASIVFRELSADSNLFTVTEADALGSSAIYENAFRLTKATPGFTDDRIYMVTATITHNGRAFAGTAQIPCLGT